MAIHPEETQLQQIQNKFLRSSSQLTIRHLCKFLSKKLNKDYQSFEFRLFEKSAPLREDISLQNAQEVKQPFLFVVIFIKLFNL